MGRGEESTLSEVSLWSQGRMFFIRQEDLAGFRKESKHPQKQSKHLPIFHFGCKRLLTVVRDSWQPHSCFLMHLLARGPLCVCLCVSCVSVPVCLCKMNSRLFVTTANEQKDPYQSVAFYIWTEPQVGAQLLSPWLAGPQCHHTATAASLSSLCSFTEYIVRR